jgi:hypothetical protein
LKIKSLIVILRKSFIIIHGTHRQRPIEFMSSAFCFIYP